MGSPDSEQDTHERSDGAIVILARALLSGRVMRVSLPGMLFSDSPDLGHMGWTLCHPDSAMTSTTSTLQGTRPRYIV